MFVYFSVGVVIGFDGELTIVCSRTPRVRPEDISDTAP